jgi:Putative restriction endonuclease
VPITIELPDLKAQTAFNVARWTEILADSRLAKLPDRIETDRHGHIIMSPPPAFTHADRQGQIADLLKSLLPNGRTLPECPLSTADGIKAVDLVWLDRGRPELIERPLVLTRAPEICVEILSPSNTPAEIDEKRGLHSSGNGARSYVRNRSASPFHSLAAPLDVTAGAAHHGHEIHLRRVRTHQEPAPNYWLSYLHTGFSSSPFADEITFELGQGAKHMKNKLSCRRTGIEAR